MALSILKATISSEVVNKPVVGKAKHFEVKRWPGELCLQFFQSMIKRDGALTNKLEKF